MKNLTTNIRKVRKYYNTNTEGAKALKFKRLAHFKNALAEDDFYELFSGKKYSLLDEIVFKTVNTGAYYCEAKTIRAKCEVGKTTLAAFNRNLKSSKQYIIARYRTLLCNFKGLIYIDTQHENFYSIMLDLFKMNENQVHEYIAAIESNIEVEQLAAFENVEVVKEKTKEEQDEIMNLYAENKYQKYFYVLIHALPLKDSVKSYAYKIALKLDDDKSTFNKAKTTFLNLVKDLNSKQIVLDQDSSIVKVFNAALNKSKEYVVPGAAPIVVAPVKKAPFYNWLEERD